MTAGPDLVGVSGPGRGLHTATALNDGRVVIIGGLIPDPTGQGGGAEIDVELFDPTASTCVSALNNNAFPDGIMTNANSPPLNNNQGQQISPVPVVRAGHTATRLQDGRVLVVGGFGFDKCDQAGNPIVEVLASAHIFDPTNDTFTMVSGALSQPRWLHSATLLPSGQVLIYGGARDDAFAQESIKEQEIFDPQNGTFTSAGSSEHGLIFCGSATIGSGGMFWGGLVVEIDPATGQADFFLPTDSTGQSIAAGNAYDGSWTSVGILTPPSVQGWAFGAADAPVNGKLFFAGGIALDITNNTTFTTGETFTIDDIQGNFTAVGTLAEPRFGAYAAAFGNGDVLVAGGSDGSGTQSAPSNPVNSAELWESSSGSFPQSIQMLTPRYGAVAVSLDDGRVAVIGGSNGGTDDLFGLDGTPTTQIEIYNN